MQSRVILLVTTDDSFGEIASRLLENHLKGRVVAVNNHTVFNILKYLLVDLLIVDSTLPASIETIRELRADPKSKDVALLVLGVGDEDAAAFRAAGADDFLLKPFELNTFVRKVKQLLRPPRIRTIT